MLAVKVFKEPFAFHTAKSICPTGKLPLPATVKRLALIPLELLHPGPADPQIENPKPNGPMGVVEYTLLPVPKSEKRIAPA
jgi:hypothetical protein